MASPLMRLGVAGLAGFFLLAAAAQSSAQTQQQQPQGPVKLDLIGTQAKWTKVCGHDQAANRDVCYTTRDFSAQANQPPVIAVAVYDIRGDDTRIVRLLMPVGLMLRPGFRFWIDKGETLDGSFEICFPNGCFAEAKIKGPTVNDMKSGTSLSIAVRNQANNEVTFAVPLAGFGEAFDGPAVDPKVLQAEQQKFQDELKKRAEEEKKRLEASKGAGAPAGGATGGASLGK
jgi:invasion protein IalB